MSRYTFVTHWEHAGAYEKWKKPVNEWTAKVDALYKERSKHTACTPYHKQRWDEIQEQIKEAEYQLWRATEHLEAASSKRRVMVDTWANHL